MDLTLYKYNLSYLILSYLIYTGSAEVSLNENVFCIQVALRVELINNITLTIILYLGSSQFM